jgi:hypothetical protein
MNIVIIYILRKDAAERMPADRIKAKEPNVTATGLGVSSFSIRRTAQSVNTAKAILTTPAYHMLNFSANKEQIVCTKA